MNQEERQYLTRILFTLLTITVVISSLVLAAGLTNHLPGAAYTALGCVALTLFMLWSTWKDNLELPRFFLPLLNFIIACMLTIRFKGLYDEAMLMFPITLILVGLLQGKSGIFVYTFLSLAIFSVMKFGTDVGLLTYPIRPTLIAFFEISVLFTYFAAVLYIIIDHLTRSLRQARKKELELAENNQELQAVRDSLKHQVKERTRNADAARYEAESARRALEIQVWQTTGQVQLGEKMRGDQDTATLANSIIRQLCTYLGAQVGAIFLRRGNLLELTAGYAYHTGQLPASYKLGQGLVGQAALENRAIHLSPVPPDSIRIFSGLGDTLPIQVIAAPFDYDGEVLGIIELGVMQELSTVHRDFLRLVSESIAIAFRTTQAREQINELLAETQRQAEEMQAQEEELRAINEELQSRTENLRLKGRYGKSE